MAKDKEVALKSAQEITTITGTSHIVPVVPGDVEVYEDMGDGSEATGLENIKMSERRIPILRPLDPKSPQCSPPENGGIPGAVGGTIFNTATSEIYDRKLGLYIIPCHTELKYVCYIKRETDGSGGGFVSIHEPEDPFVEKCRQERLRQFGNLFGKWPAGETEEGKELELVETHYMYGIMVIPNSEGGGYPGEFGSFFPAGIPFASTQIKQHGAWVERMTNMTYPVRHKDNIVRPTKVAMWTHVWHLRTFLEKRGAQTWWGWRTSLAGKGTDGMELDKKHSRLLRDNPLFIAAEELRTTILEGNAQVEYAKDAQSGDQAEGSEQDEPAAGGVKKGDIPF